MDTLRISIAARAFGLALMLGLTLLAQESAAWQTFLLGVAIAVVGSVLTSRPALRPAAVALGEGVGVALLVGSTLADAGIMLPYLAVASFVAGLYGGHRWWLATLLGQGSALLLMMVVSPSAVDVGLRQSIATWIAVAAGLGLVGAQLRSQQATLGATDASYKTARDLLAQLRELSSRLTEGLDPVSTADRIMSVAAEEVGADYAAVYIRSDDGAPLPLAYSSREASSALHDVDGLVGRCVASGEPVIRAHRQALPLVAEDRMIGVLVLQTPESPRPEVVQRCVETLAADVLRLDTSLLFDLVRSEATAEERQRLAREVHDGIAQDVASLGYLVDDLLFTDDEAERVERIRELRGELTRVVAELRLSVFDLRNRVESTEGLGSAISAFARQVGSRSDLTVHLTLDEGPHRLRPDVEQEMLRIAQEAMNNARKHSAGQNLWVRCTVYPPYAEIVVRDDGEGLGSGRSDSHGLRIMQERAERIGADLELTDGGQLRGTTLTVRLDGPGTGSYIGEASEASDIMAGAPREEAS